MTDSDHDKPVPARPSPPPARGKPTPARAVGGEPPPSAPEPDMAEATIEVAGEAWTVRVLGRAGRASGSSAPLLQLGFWRDGSESEPTLEALVVGKALGSLSDEQLAVALSRAVPPPEPGRKAPFFAEAGQSRRR